MGTDYHLLQALPGRSSQLQEELRQTFSEGIGDALKDAAENLQFSRHLFQLPQAYDQELEGIEQELRHLAARIDGVVMAMQQANSGHQLPLGQQHRLAA